ncbi:ATPase/histidine kinase/DNA gyrase B/HSP90 domain protein [delta proteobacterium NaphS2]|nr:ATPase/histidine kinase/DNA gyrase B/HSP90 domain protein [delta proteobacterium NaphS2]
MTSTTKFEDYFHGLRDVIRAMHSLTDLQSVLDMVVAKTTGAFGAEGAVLRLLNKENNLFEVRAAWGLGERYLNEGPVSAEAILSILSDLHEISIIKDIWNAPRIEHPELTWEDGVRMMVDMPLGIDEPMGIIRIYFTAERPFSDDALDFIKTVAMHCACVIKRVQLMENERSRFDHLATQVEKRSSLGRMAAGIAHEINNPLTGILLYSSNLRKKVEKGSQLEEGLNIIIKETQRCKRIIKGMLEFSREQEPEMMLADINRIMESALGIVENEFRLRQVHIRKELAQNMVNTFLDKNQIEQVFINLLLNALQAVEEKGLVIVRSDVDSKAGSVHMEVSDDGCGIVEENLNKIFEPFFSTKGDGTGLGLAVSYGIVENHKGNIRVISKPNRGARFIVELPIPPHNSTEKDRS